MFAVIGDPEAMKYYPQPLTRDDAVRWIDRSLERYRKDGYGLFAVVLKGEWRSDRQLRIVRRKLKASRMLEVGYHFRRDHWGHGYATEAARACMDYAFRQLARGESDFPYPGREPAFAARG